MSLGVIDIEDSNTQFPDLIAYPCNGYMPQSLVFPRWSFGIPSNYPYTYPDFSKASISMTDMDGKKIDLTIVSRSVDGIVGDNTIVWEPEGVITNSDEDITYTVTIKNVKNAQYSRYTYGVTIINPYN